MDAMAPRRGSDGNGAAERVVNQVRKICSQVFKLLIECLLRFLADC